MSLSKADSLFPYCNYPYTIKDKIIYYSGKIVNIFFTITGISLCSRLFCKNYLKDVEIYDKTFYELSKMVQVSKNNIIWHLKCALYNLVLFLPYTYYLYTNGYTILAYTSGLIYGKLLFLSIGSNLYNWIRYKIHRDGIMHRIKIMSAILSIQNDINILQQNNVYSKEMLNKNIRYHVDREKTLWDIITYKDYQGKISYAVYNKYFIDLVFVFISKSIAIEFMEIIKEYSIEEVEYYAENPTDAMEMKNDFLRNKIYDNLIYSYYEFSNEFYC